LHHLFLAGIRIVLPIYLNFMLFIFLPLVFKMKFMLILEKPVKFFIVRNLLYKDGYIVDPERKY